VHDFVFFLGENIKIMDIYSMELKVKLRMEALIRQRLQNEMWAETQSKMVTMPRARSYSNELTIMEERRKARPEWTDKIKKDFADKKFRLAVSCLHPIKMRNYDDIQRKPLQVAKVIGSCEQCGLGFETEEVIYEQVLLTDSLEVAEKKIIAQEIYNAHKLTILQAIRNRALLKIQTCSHEICFEEFCVDDESKAFCKYCGLNVYWKSDCLEYKQLIDDELAKYEIMELCGQLMV
jgi:hypothetical protein